MLRWNGQSRKLEEVVILDQGAAIFMLAGSPQPIGFDESETSGFVPPALVWLPSANDAYRSARLGLRPAGDGGELVAVTTTGTQTTVFLVSATDLRMIWRSKTTIPAAGLIAQDWARQAADVIVPADLDGDGFQELLFASPGLDAVAVAGRTAAAGIGTRATLGRVVQDATARSEGGWALAAGSHYVVGDLDGDGCEEVVVFAGDRLARPPRATADADSDRPRRAGLVRPLRRHRARGRLHRVAALVPRPARRHPAGLRAEPGSLGPLLRRPGRPVPGRGVHVRPDRAGAPPRRCGKLHGRARLVPLDLRLRAEGRRAQGRLRPGDQRRRGLHVRQRCGLDRRPARSARGRGNAPGLVHALRDPLDRRLPPRLRGLRVHTGVERVAAPRARALPQSARAPRRAGAAGAGGRLRRHPRAAPDPDRIRRGAAGVASGGPAPRPDQDA